MNRIKNGQSKLLQNWAWAYIHLKLIDDQSRLLAFFKTQYNFYKLIAKLTFVLVVSPSSSSLTLSIIFLRFRVVRATAVSLLSPNFILEVLLSSSFPTVEEEALRERLSRSSDSLFREISPRAAILLERVVTRSLFTPAMFEICKKLSRSQS